MTEISSSSTHPPFIANRLSLIIPPANAKPIKPKAKKKTPRKSSEMVLKNFVDLPLDIIYETVAYLEPLDLLNLARLSKEFRALFMSCTSLSIWRRVLAYVPNLPPCPQDLSEPQYASLMFEKFCMACGSSRGSIEADYKTRLRLCATCTKANIIRGYEICFKGCGCASVILTLMPFFNSPYYFFREKNFSSLKNEASMTYFKPEAELLVARFANMDANSDERVRFIEQEQENASRMINEGNALLTYKESVIQAREDADEEKAERRCNRLKEEMQALGWEEQYYPRWSDEEDFDRWEEYMFQPKEFTSRGWSLIRPKLTAIYNRTKQCRQMEGLVERTMRRYIAFRASKSVEERRRFPMWGDLLTVEFMMQFFWKNHVTCSDEQVDDFMQTIQELTRDFLEIVENDLAGMVAECDSTQMLERPAWLIDADVDSDLDTDEEQEKAAFLVRDKLNERAQLKAPSTSTDTDTASAASSSGSSSKGKGKAKEEPLTSAQYILNRASNFFMCHCPSCVSGQWEKRKVLSYPNVLDHINAITYAPAAQHWRRIKPDTSLEVIQAARDVLASLGLAEDCTRAEANALGEFVCGCGHYSYEGALSFDQLVEHVFHQQLAFAMVEGQSVKDCDRSLLVNGHCRERLADLVRIATDEDRIIPQEADDSDESVETTHCTDIPSGTYCSYCYQLMYEGWPFDEKMAYHLKYMHGKEFDEGAFMSMTNLRATYGTKYNDSILFFPFFTI